MTIDRNEEIQDQEELQRTIFETLQAGLWTAIPCIVESVNFVKQTVEAVPAIKAKVSDKDGNIIDVELPLLVDIPLCFPRAGGFALTFPVAAGDECLVIFASRCIDSWWQSGGVQSQAELRMHDLSDGFAILAPTSQPKVLPNVSETNVELRNEAGTSYVQINSTGGMNLHTPDSTVSLFNSGKVVVTTPLVEINAPSIKLNGDVTIDGALTVNNGNLWVSDDSKVVAHGTAGYKSIGRTHTHGGGAVPD